MFFRSWKSLVLAKIVIVVGCVLLFWGWTDADAAKREATAAGTISNVSCGRGCTYEYIFRVNGVRIEDDSDTCHTALTTEGCNVGAPVLVYYDPEHLSNSKLEEFGVLSRERYFMGIWMVSCGLFLIGLYFILQKFGKNSDDEEEPCEGDGDDKSDVLHVVPGE
jgi:hypothetical protein